MKGLLLAAFAAISISAARAYDIDNFTDGDSYIQLTTGSSTSNTAASVVGGYRYTALDVGANLYGLSCSAAVQGGAYTLNNDAGVYGYSYLGYGYGANGTPVDLNFNMAAQGNALEFDFAEITIALNFNVVVFTDTTYGAYGINIGAENSGPYDLTVPLSDFSSVGSPDYSHVTNIFIEFNQSSGLLYGDNIALTGFKVVPEPAGVCGLGLGALVLMRRRRR